jgi:hypothetical protein
MPDIVYSKTGLPCVWESGGGRTHTGSSQIVCDRNGLPISPLYIKQRGTLVCGQHALFHVKPGTYVIRASRRHLDYEVEVYMVQDSPTRLELVYSYSQGEWVPDLPMELEAAVEAAKGKTTEYHCRRPVYFK